MKVIAAVLFTIPSATAKPAKTYTTKHISYERGLVSNRVPSVFIDDHGFLWIATYNGLARYDGTNFQNFKREPGNINSLKTSQVNAIYVENSPAWDQNTPPSYTAFVGLNNDKGIQIIENGKVTGHLLDGYSIKGNGITKVAGNNLRVISGEKMFLINSKTREVLEEHEFDARISSVSNGLSNVIVGTNKGVRFIGEPLARFSRLKNTNIRTIVSTDNSHYIGTESGLFRVTNNSIEHYFPGIVVRAINVSLSTVIIGTSNGAIECSVHAIEESKCDSYLEGKIITSIAREPSSDLVWLSTTNDGVYQLSDNRHLISSFSSVPGVQFHSYSSMKNGLKIVASDGNGAWTSENGENWKKMGISNIGSDRILTMDQDELGKVWMGHYKGLTIIDESLERPLRLLTEHIVLEVKHIDGFMYVGTDSDGLYQFTLGGKLVNTFNKQTGLASDSIMAIEKASRGGIWVGTESGFYLINGNQVERFAKDVAVWSILDNGENLLIGTDGDGLLLYRDNQLTNTFNTTNSNIPSNTVSDIKYKSGRYFFATLGGLAYTQDFQSQWFDIITKRDGIQPSELLRNALSFDQFNNLVVAGADGWSTIKSLDFMSTVPSYPVYLEQEPPSKIEFGERFSLSFTGVNHTKNYPTKYSYSLDNLPMNDIGHTNSLVFDALAPGEHILRVQAYSRTAAGMREIRFTVSSPVQFKGNGFLIAAAFMFILAIIVIQKNFYNRELFQKEAKINSLEKDLDFALIHGIGDSDNSIEFVETLSLILPLELPEAFVKTGFIRQLEMTIGLSSIANRVKIDIQDRSFENSLSRREAEDVYYLLAYSINSMEMQNNKPSNISINFSSSDSVEVRFSDSNASRLTALNQVSSLHKSCDFKISNNGSDAVLLISLNK